MSRHAALMDSAGYWRQFESVFYFDEPGDAVAGLIIELVGARKGDPPAMKIQTREGDVFIVPAHQARLLTQLKRLAPAVGDRIRIVFDGVADKAAPGMNKAKLFTVDLRRGPPRPQDRPPGSGDNAEDNDPGAGP